MQIATALKINQPFSSRSSILRIHRWLGLGAGLLWLLQAITGVILVFHFELQDTSLSATHRPTDLAGIERRIDAIRTDAGQAGISWVWTTAGLPDRYVIAYADASGEPRMAHVDGAGTLLVDRKEEDLGFFGAARELHMTLASGQVGHWVLGISGIFLLTNLVAGLVLAWPRRRNWRTALRPLTKGNAAPRLYSWHRALGLYLVIPAIFIVCTGTLMQFEEPLHEILDAPEIILPANPPKRVGVGFAAVVKASVSAIPGSEFVGTTFPSAVDASYYAWVRASGELYRDGGYGGSLVIVDANDGSVRGTYPAGTAPARYAFLGSLYPLHTGEAVGLPGRVIALAVGLWLTAMIVIGAMLWLRRRADRTRRLEPS